MTAADRPVFLAKLTTLYLQIGAFVLLIVMLFLPGDPFSEPMAKLLLALVGGMAAALIAKARGSHRKFVFDAEGFTITRLFRHPIRVNFADVIRYRHLPSSQHITLITNQRQTLDIDLSKIQRGNEMKLLLNDELTNDSVAVKT